MYIKSSQWKIGFCSSVQRTGCTEWKRRGCSQSGVCKMHCHSKKIWPSFLHHMVYKKQATFLLFYHSLNDPEKKGGLLVRWVWVPSGWAQIHRGRPQVQGLSLRMHVWALEGLRHCQTSQKLSSVVKQDQCMRSHREGQSAMHRGGQSPLLALMCKKI